VGEEIAHQRRVGNEGDYPFHVVAADPAVRLNWCNEESIRKGRLTENAAATSTGTRWPEVKLPTFRGQFQTGTMP